MVTAETKESGITHMAFDDQTLEVSLMTVIQGYTQSCAPAATSSPFV